MKKFILAVLLSLVSVAATAATTSVEVGYGVQPASKIYSATASYDNFALAVSRDTVSRAELGYTLHISNFNNLFAVTGWVGEASDGILHTTYAVEPSVSYHLLPTLEVYGSYKYRNTLNASVKDHTDTETLGVRYALFKGIGVGAKVFNEVGDTKEHGIVGTASLSF